MSDDQELSGTCIGSCADWQCDHKMHTCCRTRRYGLFNIILYQCPYEPYTKLLYIHSHEQLFNGMVSIATLVKYINEAKIPADEEKILFEAILKKRSTKEIMKICNAERRDD